MNHEIQNEFYEMCPICARKHFRQRQLFSRYVRLRLPPLPSGTIYRDIVSASADINTHSNANSHCKWNATVQGVTVQADGDFFDGITAKTTAILSSIVTLQTIGANEL